MPSHLDHSRDLMEDLLAYWLQSHEHWPLYTTDLGLEGLLAYYDATGDSRALDHVLNVWKFRGDPSFSLTFGNCYFTCLHYETFLRTGDPSFITGIVELAGDWIENAPRTPEGAIAHRHRPHGALLLDMAAGLFPLLARAGQLSGDTRFFKECEQQVRLYRQILIDPFTGLWHHGRGWNPSAPWQLSPPGWARGQGWVMRGLFKAWEAFPQNSEEKIFLQDQLLELRDAVLGFQSACGLWKQLMHREDSLVESSGSGLLIEVITRMACIPEFSLNEEAVRRAVNAGLCGLNAMISAEGVVLHCSPETAPRATEEEYLAMQLRPADPHAQAALLLAKSAAIQFDGMLH